MNPETQQHIQEISGKCAELIRPGMVLIKEN